MVVTASHGGGVEDIDTSQTGALFEAVRDHIPGLDVAASGQPGGVNFAANDRPEFIQQQRVSAGYFRVLGMAPEIGREFSRQEDVPEGVAVAILSHAFWQRALHGDPATLGRTISLRGEEYTVVGIMPRDFRTGSPVDVAGVIRPAILLSVGGIGAGLGLSLVAVRFLRAMLWGVRQTDPVTFAAT